ncbi:MBL fold metallo-hydrolase [Pseudonocardia kunmingensis]|uniref:MBL fold metallo-hydrolase n=1 Tax=Pseudonocardia kunmingensis TaxID=630975 RepID=UPI001FE83CD3|nr:MBL fold metallo-hydrolase [Pseudonocardia kunmingensis]
MIDSDGVLHLDLGGFLVRTGERTVLVDAGVGTIDNGKYAGGGFLDSLRAHGVAPVDVTDVVFTHLHFDHVGWATKKGEVVFPNATYRVHAEDWSHFVEAADAEPGAVRKLSPLESRLETFTADGALAPGVSARHTPGHTPGSTVFVISDGDERALLLGDVVHSVVELAERDWEAVFDVDPVAASAVRNALADEVADSTDVVVGAHFPGLRFGRVVTAFGNRTFRAL